MRSKEEILKTKGKFSLMKGHLSQQADLNSAILEVLLDIRELLQKSAKKK